MAPSALSLPTSVSDEKYANVKWEELGFGFCRTDNMYVAKCKHGESFQEGKIVPYADLQISPCSAVLNYGQKPCFQVYKPRIAHNESWNEVGLDPLVYAGGFMRMRSLCKPDDQY
ncbi:hypothetical protein F2Q70_00022900 [Brassica cretica]|uniref:Uncharacterized protein n=1 Tax=Brassica cretica TaxID=69181 RepID=A0A8S9GSA0_BRACR|nr:hypothetical protein F2Q70_00022900 [Brassica cretica]